MAYKLKQKNDHLKIFSAEVTKLEIELVRAKQDLGEALNAVYEYEQTAADKELMTQMENNMTFKEVNNNSGSGRSGGDSDFIQDGGSGG